MSVKAISGWYSGRPPCDGWFEIKGLGIVYCVVSTYDDKVNIGDGTGNGNVWALTNSNFQMFWRDSEKSPNYKMCAIPDCTTNVKYSKFDICSRCMRKQPMNNTYSNMNKIGDDIINVIHRADCKCRKCQ